MEIVEAGCVAGAPSTLRDVCGDALLRWNTRRAACASRVKKRTSLGRWKGGCDVKIQRLRNAKSKV